MGAWLFMSKQARIEAVKDGFSEGRSIEDLAEAYGWPVDRLRTFIILNGIEPPRLAVAPMPLERSGPGSTTLVVVLDGYHYAHLARMAGEANKPAEAVAAGIIAAVLDDDAAAHAEAAE